MAGREIEDDTAGISKGDHAYIWVNELEELVAWIGGEWLGARRQSQS